MKAAIRYTIIALIAAAIAVILGKTGVTHTDEKEIRAGVGLIVSLVGYVFVYIIALARHTTSELNAPLTNWHWIEVTAFYFFLFLAPDTILDNLQERAVQQQIQELQSEIAILRGGEL